MPVAMTTSIESKPDRTNPSTQELPIIPTVQDMEAWSKKRVLRWVRKRSHNILKGDDLEKFNNANVTGRAFLFSSFEFFKSCALSPGVCLVLAGLVDEVKGGKFIPWTELRHQLTVSKASSRTRQLAGRGRVTTSSI
jgi:hypothetical protein